MVLGLGWENITGVRNRVRARNNQPEPTDFCSMAKYRNYTQCVHYQVETPSGNGREEWGGGFELCRPIMPQGLVGFGGARRHGHS